MATDVILDDEDGSWLTLSAAVIHGAASDLMLATPARRSSMSGYRRALVHDEKDGLTINFNNDYPGGVTINSVTRISPKISSDIAHPLGFKSMPELVIDGGVKFVWNYGPTALKRTEEMSLQAIIESLQKEIITLKDRITALGG